MAERKSTKAAAKKTTTKKPAADKASAKKPAAGKASSKKPAAKKPTARKAPAKKAPAKKAPAKKTPAKKTATAAKPAGAAKKTPSKGTSTAKVPAKTPARRTPARDSATTEDSKPEIKLEMSASRQFNAWLAEQNLSIAFSTYQTGKVFLIGLQPTGRLSVFERTFNRCMGLCFEGDTLHLSSLYQLWRFENVLAPGQAHDGYDRVFVPMQGHTTGDLDIHDIAVNQDGRVVFVNTLFSCLATVGDRTSFQPLWKPPFVSKLAAEDRCHLNGLAMADGKPRYVTAVGKSDVPNGWRDKRRDAGLLIDVTTDEIVADNLAMPHSPRVYRGKVWILNSGTGELGTVDPGSGAFESVTFCPGYLRGLSFHGDFALVGLSKPRENKTFTGLPLDDAMAGKNATAQCGIYVIDIRSGDVVHWLNIEGIVEELYDVVAMPGVRRPMALGFKTDEIRRTISMSDMGSL